jgi:hypothetical protein
MLSFPHASCSHSPLPAALIHLWCKLPSRRKQPLPVSRGNLPLPQTVIIHLWRKLPSSASGVNCHQLVWSITPTSSAKCPHMQFGAKYPNSALAQTALTRLFAQNTLTQLCANYTHPPFGAKYPHSALSQNSLTLPLARLLYLFVLCNTSFFLLIFLNNQIQLYKFADRPAAQKFSLVLASGVSSI